MSQTVGSVAKTDSFAGGGSRYQVYANNGSIYEFYRDQQNDLLMRKSNDYGLTWIEATLIKAGTIITWSVWYDRWSGISGDVIHLAWTDSGDDDIHYNGVDTASSDALVGETTVFAGSTTAAAGALSITVARGGNIVVAGSIDAGAEDGAWESADAGATWASAIADPSEAATQDQYLLLPGWNADTQDVMLIFWDASADELSVKRYDDSANTWTETSIATGMTDTPFSTAGPHRAATVDLTNSINIVVAWTAVDTASASLRCWTINDTTITEKTAVVSSSTDDQAFAAISLDTVTGYWWCFYGGATDGSETFNAAPGQNVYCKVSKDSGVTWGPETALTQDARILKQVGCCPRSSRQPLASCISLFNASYDYRVIVESRKPNASFNLGI